jgi:hypothetical protein
MWTMQVWRRSEWHDLAHFHILLAEKIARKSEKATCTHGTLKLLLIVVPVLLVFRFIYMHACICRLTHEQGNLLRTKRSCEIFLTYMHPYNRVTLLLMTWWCATCITCMEWCLHGLQLRCVFAILRMCLRATCSLMHIFLFLLALHTLPHVLFLCVCHVCIYTRTLPSTVFVSRTRRICLIVYVCVSRIVFRLILSETKLWCYWYNLPVQELKYLQHMHMEMLWDLRTCSSVSRCSLNMRVV